MEIDNSSPIVMHASRPPSNQKVIVETSAQTSGTVYITVDQST